MLNYQFGETGDLATADSLFIEAGATKIEGLVGITEDEFANDQDYYAKEGKFLLSFGVMLSTYLNSNPILGLTGSKTDSPTTENRIEDVFSFTFSLVSNIQAKTVSVLPLATDGDNANFGTFKLTDVFAGISKLASGAAFPSNGVAIPVSSLVFFGSSDYASIDLAGDNRDTLFALLSHISTEAEIRDANTATGVTDTSAIAASLGTFEDNTFAIVDLDTSEVTNNPITSLLQSQGLLYVLNDFEMSFSVESLRNQIQQTFDVVLDLA